MSNVLISREEFSNILIEMEKVSRISDNVRSLYMKSGNKSLRDGCEGAGVSLAFEETVIWLLTKIMNDHNKIIDDYIYEYDFGKEPVLIEGEGGVQISISTPDELYDYLVSNMEV